MAAIGDSPYTVIELEMSRPALAFELRPRERALQSQSELSHRDFANPTKNSHRGRVGGVGLGFAPIAA